MTKPARLSAGHGGFGLFDVAVGLHRLGEFVFDEKDDLALAVAQCRGQRVVGVMQERSKAGRAMRK